MRTRVYNFFLAVLVFGVAPFTGCQSSAEKTESAQEKVEEAKDELKEAQQDANADAVLVANDADWQAFRTDAEEKIRKNEARITELKVKMKKPGTKMDAAYEKNIQALEQKNADLKAGLTGYENNRSDWESFKREFNHDMDELGRALQDLTEDNKK